MDAVKRKFTQEEVGLIHRTMMEGASADDVAVFVSTCERTGLDPFAGQIMPRKGTSNQKDARGNWTKKVTWSALVRIDGFRKMAVDTGEYEGQEGPFWCGKDGVWKDVWLASVPPEACKVIVHRRNFKFGLPAVALFHSYAQKSAEGKLNNIWSTMGELMIAKCAEALALRKAFPNELAGLYTTDEMAQADNPKPSEPKSEVKHEEPKAPEPAKANPGESEWTIPDQEDFAVLADRVYGCLKRVGKPEAYDKTVAPWNQRRRESGIPNAVLTDFRAFVEKIEKAEKDRKPVEKYDPSLPPKDKYGDDASLPEDSPAETMRKGWEAIKSKAPYSALTPAKWAKERERLEKSWMDSNPDDPELAVAQGMRRLIETLG